MKKYLKYLEISITRQFVYPMEFFSIFIFGGLLFVLELIIWKAVYIQRADIEGFTYVSIATYYGLSVVTRQLTRSKNITWQMAEDIQDGNISTYLVKPISYSTARFIESFSSGILTTIAPFLIFMAATSLIPNFFYKSTNFSAYIVSLMLATFITHFMYTCIGTIAFFMTKTWGVISVFGRITQLLSGGVIPIAFFPAVAVSISNFLPFQYINYIPSRIYLGFYNTAEILKLLGYQVIWIVLLVLLYKFLWVKGLKNHESVGN